jgi:hypothetical protein
MSRFDDELRRAVTPLADEPMPDGILDAAFDSPPAPRWPIVALAAAGLGLAMALGFGAASLVPSPSPTATAGSSVVADRCEDVPPPAGGGDIVLVYFPCEAGSLELARGIRSIDSRADADSRLEAAIRALLDGPSALEADAGMVPVVAEGSGALLTHVAIQADGLAVVDFAPAFGDAVPTETARAGAFINALRATALDLAEVTAIEPRIAGDCQPLFALLGGECQHLAAPIGERPDCPVIPPVELPSGGPPTAPRSHPTEPGTVTWGTGADTVTEQATVFELHLQPHGGYGEPVRVHGQDGYVGPAMFDEGDAPHLIWWQEGRNPENELEAPDCQYIVTLAPGLTRDDAREYVARFDGGVPESTPTPAPTPAEPPDGIAEQDGIRVTIELDRDRIAPLEQVWAELTVENVGGRTVYWSHPSACTFGFGPYASIQPDLTEDAQAGENWPRDLQGVKERALVDQRWGFQLEQSIGFEGGSGCTTASVTDVLGPGQRLTNRAVWDGYAPFGRPALPCDYVVATSFTHYGPEEPVGVDAVPDQLVVTARIPLTVEGPTVTLVSAVEAVDSILADPEFVEAVDQQPDVATNVTLEFGDGEWLLVLEYGDRVIRAAVDATTGLVERVEGP